MKVAQHVQLFATPWTIQSMEFSRPEYWSGWPFPFPGDLPNPEIEPRSPALQVDFLPAEPQRKPKNTGVGSLSLLQGDLPDPGIKLGSPALQVDSLPTELSGISGKLIAGKRFRNLLGMHYFYEKQHRTLHKTKDVNHHIIHIPALPTCITTAGMCSIFLSKMQSTTTIKIP